MHTHTHISVDCGSVCGLVKKSKLKSPTTSSFNSSSGLQRIPIHLLRHESQTWHWRGVLGLGHVSKRHCKTFQRTFTSHILHYVQLSVGWWKGWRPNIECCCVEKKIYGLDKREVQCSFPALSLTLTFSLSLSVLYSAVRMFSHFSLKFVILLHNANKMGECANVPFEVK